MNATFSRNATLSRSLARRESGPRTLAIEPLESRRMLAATPWHNPNIALDVNNSGTVTALDALAVISELIRTGSRQLEPPTSNPPLLYLDTNGDNLLTARDALAVVNRILRPTQVTLSTLVPFSIDVTPAVSVQATSLAGLPNGTPVKVDVDLNNDGDFSDVGESNRSVGTLFQGAADFTLDPALPASPPAGLYTVRLRAHVTDSQGIEGFSPVVPLVIDTAVSTALSDYVHTPDASYHYSVANVSAGDGYTYYLLDMTSQTWRSSADVNMPDWRHWIQVIVPTGAIGTTALLFITGGSNGFTSQPSIDATTQSVAQTALATHTVAAILRTVPSEPLIFTDETRTRSEDEIIAYSFDKYMTHIGQPGNDTWPVLLAMAKSAVRAMDTVSDFVPLVSPTSHVDHYVVTGYSKRGWTTWLTAAADDRVVGIIPGVFDNLDQGPQMVHHYAAYGFFADDVQDYSDMHIFDRIMTPEGEQLSKIVDPYRYLNNGHFEIPKLILNSAGDEFFVPDSSQFYIHDLPGTSNYMRYFPNTGHGLDASAATSTLTFYDAIINNRALPKFTWTVEPDGAIVVHSDDTPSNVVMWQATNPDARDFRNSYTNTPYSATPLSDLGGQTYIANPDMPSQGARAYFIELDYPSGIPGIPYQFTTEIHIKSTLPLHPWPFASGILTATAQDVPAADPQVDLGPVAGALTMQALAVPPPPDPLRIDATVVEQPSTGGVTMPSAAAVAVGTLSTLDESDTSPDDLDGSLVDSVFDGAIDEILA
jgi:PhoPQ-activated pathogenicity-related protein